MPKAYNARDQAKHFAAVVVCCRALPKSSRSRQRSESAVDTSCTSMAYMILQEENPKGLTLWTFSRIAKTQKNKRFGDSCRLARAWAQLADRPTRKSER